MGPPEKKRIPEPPAVSVHQLGEGIRVLGLPQWSRRTTLKEGKMTRRNVLWGTLLTLAALLQAAPTGAQEPPWIFGMHDPGAEGEMEARGKQGWIVFTEAIGTDPNDHSGKDYSPWRIGNASI
jgi:hypothetical protein